MSQSYPSPNPIKNTHQLLYQYSNQITSSNHNRASQNILQKPKGDYVKKFFERRLKIEMEVRSKILLEAKIKKKTMGMKEYEKDSAHKRSKGKDLNMLLKQNGCSFNKVSKDTLAKKMEAKQKVQQFRFHSNKKTVQTNRYDSKTANQYQGFTDPQIRNWAQMQTKNQLGHSKFFKEQQKMEANQLRQMGVKYFKNNQQNQNGFACSLTQKMRSGKSNVDDEYLSELNPEKVYLKRGGKIENKAPIKQTFLQDRIDFQSQKRKEKPSVSKYEIDMALRQRLMDILQKQRDHLNISENHEKLREFSCKHNNSIQAEENEEQLVLSNEISGISSLNMVTQILKTFMQIECPIAHKVAQNRKYKDCEQKDFADIGNSTEHLAQRLITQELNEEELYINSDSEISNEVRIRGMSNVKVNRQKQTSLVICAICQNNIEQELWQYVQVFQPDHDNQSQQNESLGFVQNFNERIPMLLQCGHSFHKVCVLSWLQYKPLCPLCKTLLREQSDEDDESLEYENEESQSYSSNNGDEQEQQDQQMQDELNSVLQIEEQVTNRAINLSFQQNTENLQASSYLISACSFEKQRESQSNMSQHSQIQFANQSNSSESSFGFQSVLENFAALLPISSQQN